MDNMLEKNIADLLDMKFAIHNLEKINMKWVNAFEINNDLVFLYPLNDGMPTCRFEFYKGGQLILSNKREFQEITNLDEILLQMVRIINSSLDSDIVLDPYYFMLELTDGLCKDYHGKAKLVITDKAIRNRVLTEDNFEEAREYFINKFLDHFIGWNFGVSVNRNDELKNELKELNNKVIDMGIREYAGSGFEVYGVSSKEYDGLQHYNLPVERHNLTK